MASSSESPDTGFSSVSVVSSVPSMSQLGQSLEPCRTWQSGTQTGTRTVDADYGELGSVRQETTLVRSSLIKGKEERKEEG